MGAATLGIKSVQTALYILLFLATAVVLALYSYFLATESIHHAGIPTKQRAIEGISGAGVLYSIFAVILTCFLGGITFFAFLGIVLDILFTGGFIAIAILTRDGVHSCTANSINTPIGSGPPTSKIGRNGKTFSIKLKTACRMEKVVFAVSIIAAALFLLAAIFQLWLGRRHQKDKRYGPSPANNYTSGSARGGFFSRRRARKAGRGGAAAEAGVIGTNGVGNNHHHGHNGHAVEDHRLSHGTATTDSYVGNKYEGQQVAGGYHTAPAGAGVNPYGYENERSHAV